MKNPELHNSRCWSKGNGSRLDSSDVLLQYTREAASLFHCMSRSVHIIAIRT